MCVSPSAPDILQNAPPYYNQISLSPRNSLSSAAYRETIIFAVTCFDNAVNWKGAWEHHLRKGKALEKLGRNDEALDAFMQARVSGSEWLEPHYRLFSSAQKAVLLQRCV
jgi:tetratricopeptide (TPR) repeat protein